MNITPIQLNDILSQIKASLYEILEKNGFNIENKKTVDDFIIAFLSEVDVTHKQLMSKNRVTKIKTIRFVISYILYNNYNMTYSAIGKKMGGLNHTTIIHHCKTSNIFLETQDELFLFYYNIATNCIIKTKN